MSLTPYAAACVRSCALRNMLLSRQEWQSLAGISDTRALLDWLKTRGIVGGDITDVLSAERSGHEAVIQRATGLLRFARGDVARLIEFFVHYYDLLNVEGVANQIHTCPEESRSPEYRFYDTGPFGLVRPAALEAVTNFPALGHALKHTFFSVPFDGALLRYHDDDDVVRMVEHIEFAFFSAWLNTAQGGGIDPRTGGDTSPLAVFLVARAIEAATRLTLHRKAEPGRAVQWLALVAPPKRVSQCRACLSGDDGPAIMRDLLTRLLPSAVPRQSPLSSDPRGEWGLLDRAIMEAAMRATRGIAFNTDFLTGFLLRQMCQARELTVLLETREANLATPSTSGGGHGE